MLLDVNENHSHLSVLICTLVGCSVSPIWRERCTKVEPPIMASRLTLIMKL